MKSGKKALLLALCAVLLVAATVMGTMAYLVSTDEVVNTFTIGNVKITLDEAQVDVDGKAVTPTARVKANSYKLMPGHTYTKDPTVTVEKGSEPSYIKMTVAITKADALDNIFAPSGADLASIFKDYDANWELKNNTKTGDTRTYEFWYKNIVDASKATEDVALAPLFKSITVPGEITNEQLETIKDMTITVNAYAIQADGFKTAEDAWEAFN